MAKYINRDGFGELKWIGLKPSIKTKVRMVNNNEDTQQKTLRHSNETGEDG